MWKGQGVWSSAVMQESEKKYFNREEKSDCLMWNNSCVFETATGESWLWLPSSCRCFCGSGTKRKKVIARKWLMVHIQLCERTSVGICFFTCSQFLPAVACVISFVISSYHHHDAVIVTEIDIITGTFVTVTFKLLFLSFSSLWRAL